MGHFMLGREDSVPEADDEGDDDDDGPPLRIRDR